MGCIPGELVTPGGGQSSNWFALLPFLSLPSSSFSYSQWSLQSWEREIDSFKGEKKGVSLSFQAGMREVKIHSCEMGLK